MRSQFLLVPAAIIASVSAHAEDYLTVEEAQQAVFPGAKFTPADFTMNEAQVDALIKATNATVFRSRVKAWKVSTGGWFFLDQVPGRDDRITYAIGIDEKGAVKAIEVLVCLAGYSGVRDRDWRGQFSSKSHKPGTNMMSEIANIAGTTLSVEHIVEGVTRMLATHAMYANGKTG